MVFTAPVLPSKFILHKKGDNVIACDFEYSKHIQYVNINMGIFAMHRLANVAYVIDFNF